MSDLEVTSRTKVKRLPKRGSYDVDTIHQILDEALICHVGFVSEGSPFVIPTGYARVGGLLYIHGSAASRMLRNLSEGVEVCVTVTILDGLVLARSAFHHSMNYRSVVVLGRAREVVGEEKEEALRLFVEKMIPERSDHVRDPSESELKQTTVLAIPLEEASAKIRTGPPLDDEEDYAMDVWAGVVPLRMAVLEPVADPKLPESIAVPEHVRALVRKR